MRAWDSIARRISLGPRPAVLLIPLAAVVLLLAPWTQRIESRVFDLLLGLQQPQGSSQIVVVDTQRWRGSVATIWEHDQFPDLLNALGNAGVRLILPAEVPPLAATLPDSRQLAALAQLDRLRHKQPQGMLPNPITDPWLEITRRSDLHARTVQTAKRLGNLILALPVIDGAGAATSALPACQKNFPVMTATRQLPPGSLRTVRSVAAVSDDLCQAALGMGHAEFWSDPDGVVRRLELAVTTPAGHMQSAALSAAWLFTSLDGVAPQIEPGRISWNPRQISSSSGASVILRSYGSTSAGSFKSIAAEDLIHNQQLLPALEGKIAILGDATSPATQSYVSADGQHLSPAWMLATSVSNLLLEDYVVRPSWMGWVEILLLVSIAAASLSWSRLLPPALAAMIAVLSVGVLLLAESYLLSCGLWAQLGASAVFAPLCIGVACLNPRRQLKSPAVAIQRAGPQLSLSRPRPDGTAAGDELDLAFSMLRHQPSTEQVKKRLYDLALEHARRRDLAKAERVLRHLAAIDPDYRRAGEKLKRLTGPRQAEPAALTRMATAAPCSAPIHDANLSGQSIGRYRIEQQIGHGAMATVYLGRDPKINRRVAIKTIALADEFSDTDLDNARAQFLREAESAGRLNHPDIISIYDAGEDGRIAYLAMEYFAGRPLSHYTQLGRLLPPAKVLDIMARAAEALHYAHNHHVVHRDVKPANLLYDEATDTLKITDFGIARLTDTSRTKTGIILGTPSYMSPEQLAGSVVTGQSDLFSLGVTLYQLLAGAPPFRADSIPKLMQKIAHEAHAPLHNIRDDVPEAIDAVLDRALAKKPADRYHTGREMALALRDCCSNFEQSTAILPA